MSPPLGVTPQGPPGAVERFRITEEWSLLWPLLCFCSQVKSSVGFLHLWVCGTSRDPCDSLVVEVKDLLCIWHLGHSLTFISSFKHLSKTCLSCHYYLWFSERDTVAQGELVTCLRKRGSNSKSTMFRLCLTESMHPLSRRRIK